MNEPSVVAVGTPQSFRQQLARALEIEPEEVGWVQSATAAEELLIHAFNPIEVLVLSPEVKEPDALGLAEFVGRQAPGTAIVLVRDHTWNGLLPAAMRAGIRDVVDMTQGNEELRDAVERAIVWASNLRSVSVAPVGRVPVPEGPDHVGVLVQGRGRQDLPHDEPGLRHRGASPVRTRPWSTSTSTWVTSSPTSAPSRPRASPTSWPWARVRPTNRSAAWVSRWATTCGRSAPRSTRRPRRPPESRSASSSARSATTSRTWWSTRRSTIRTPRSCASTSATSSAWSPASTWSASSTWARPSTP